MRKLISTIFIVLFATLFTNSLFSQILVTIELYLKSVEQEIIKSGSNDIIIIDWKGNTLKRKFVAFEGMKIKVKNPISNEFELLSLNDRVKFIKNKRKEIIYDYEFFIRFLEGGEKLSKKRSQGLEFCAGEWINKEEAEKREQELVARYKEQRKIKIKVFAIGATIDPAFPLGNFKIGDFKQSKDYYSGLKLKIKYKIKPFPHLFNLNIGFLGTFDLEKDGFPQDFNYQFIEFPSGAYNKKYSTSWKNLIVLGGKVNIFSITSGINYYIIQRKRRISSYLLGEIGLYRITREDINVSGYCKQYYSYDLPGYHESGSWSFPVDDLLIKFDTQNKFGIILGGGFDFSTKKNKTIIVENKYHMIFTGTVTTFFILRAGLLFTM